MAASPERTTPGLAAKLNCAYNHERATERTSVHDSRPGCQDRGPAQGPAARRAGAHRAQAGEDRPAQPLHRLADEEAAAALAGLGPARVQRPHRARSEE